MKKDTIIYGIIVGGLAIASLTFFGLAQYKKARAASSKTTLTLANRELTTIQNDRIKAQKMLNEGEISVETYNELAKLFSDKEAYYTEIKDTFSEIDESNKKGYVGLSIPAYSLSMLTLISFGLCLKHADSKKEKEDKEI